MESFKRKIQHSIIKMKSLLKDKKFHSQHVVKRMEELGIANPVIPEKALFNFSIDFELVWGNGETNGKEISSEKRIQNALVQAEAFGPFMDMLDEIGFPITWATLGRLANSDTIPPQESAFNPDWSIDWYDSHYKNLENQIWDGTSYLDRIKEAKVDHEVQSHGYAHIDYSDSSTSEKVAAWDIETSLMELRSYGFEVNGFVYPCNRPKYENLLPKNGVEIIRGIDQSWVTQGELKKTPLGFWISPAIYGLDDMIKIIDHAVERKSFIHPWMHLIECDLNEDDIENFYRPIFEYILKLQRDGLVENISFKRINELLK